MTRADDSFANRAAQLRQAFDRSFAEAVHADTATFDDWLAIRLRDDPHVLRLGDVACLLPVRALTRFPSAVPEWLGLAGVAGVVVPVYDLGALLGYPAGAPPRWMALCKSAPVALAFDAFDGQFRHPRETPSPPTAAPSGQGEVLRTEDQVRPVVPVARILANIETLARDDAQTREH